MAKKSASLGRRGAKVNSRPSAIAGSKAGGLDLLNTPLRINLRHIVIFAAVFAVIVSIAAILVAQKPEYALTKARSFSLPPGKQKIFRIRQVAPRYCSTNFFKQLKRRGLDSRPLRRFCRGKGSFRIVKRVKAKSARADVLVRYLRINLPRTSGAVKGAVVAFRARNNPREAWEKQGFEKLKRVRGGFTALVNIPPKKVVQVAGIVRIKLPRRRGITQQWMNFILPQALARTGNAGVVRIVYGFVARIGEEKQAASSAERVHLLIMPALVTTKPKIDDYNAITFINIDGGPYYIWKDAEYQLAGEKFQQVRYRLKQPACITLTPRATAHANVSSAKEIAEKIPYTQAQFTYYVQGRAVKIYETREGLEGYLHAPPEKWGEEAIRAAQLSNDNTLYLCVNPKLFTGKGKWIKTVLAAMQAAYHVPTQALTLRLANASKKIDNLKTVNILIGGKERYTAVWKWSARDGRYNLSMFGKGEQFFAKNSFNPEERLKPNGQNDSKLPAWVTVSDNQVTFRGVQPGEYEASSYALIVEGTKLQIAGAKDVREQEKGGVKSYLYSHPPLTTVTVTLTGGGIAEPQAGKGKFRVEQQIAPPNPPLFLVEKSGEQYVVWSIEVRWDAGKVCKYEPNLSKAGCTGSGCIYYPSGFKKEGECVAVLAKGEYSARVTVWGKKYVPNNNNLPEEDITPYVPIAWNASGGVWAKQEEGNVYVMDENSLTCKKGNRKAQFMVTGSGAQAVYVTYSSYVQPSRGSEKRDKGRGKEIFEKYIRPHIPFFSGGWGGF
jgi:hypothetical protein